jgi:uncharacterized RDD family membrane protein YckC
MGSTYGAGTLYCGECGRPTPPDELARFGDLLVCPFCKESYAQKLREGVAPAVAFTYGGFWIRFLAILVDFIILMIVDSIVQYALVGTVIAPIRQPAPGTRPEEFLMSMLGTVGILWIVNMALNACYEGFFVANMGATPGKMAMGLKVVRPNGAPIGLGRSFGRYFAKMLSGMILAIGYIMAGFDAEKRALHDMICDTRVIKAR